MVNPGGPSSEDGATSAEYVSVLVIVAAIIGLVFTVSAVGIGASMRDSVAMAMCRIGDAVGSGEGCTAPEDPPPPSDPSDPGGPSDPSLPDDEGSDREGWTPEDIDAALAALPPGTEITDGSGDVIWRAGDGFTGDADLDLVLTYIATVHDYLLTTFGRDSYDGAGGALTIVLDHRVDPSSPWENAHWDTGGNVMRYGEGFALLDVIAHELAHGLLFAEGLSAAGESRAVHESMADIFASNVDGNWTIGEDAPVSWAPFRDMSQLTHIDDYDGVSPYQGAEVTNHAYYQMIDGVGGLDRGTAEQIAYRAATTHLPSDAGLADLREAFVQATIDLHGAGSAEVEAVIASFEVVGL